MAYVYPGQAYTNRLLALKGWYRESALDAEVQVDASVNIGSTNNPLLPGMVVHPVSIQAAITPYTGPVNGPGTFVCEMGAAGFEMPIYLWSGPSEPDVNNPGIAAGYSAGGTTGVPPDFISVLPETPGGNQNMVGLVAAGHYEVETTGFDTAQTYVTGQGIRTVTSNTDTNAGLLTNQRATTVGFNSAGLVQWGASLSAWDTIVGMVSRGTYTNAFMRPVLALWTVFYPGTR